MLTQRLIANKLYLNLALIGIGAISLSIYAVLGTLEIPTNPDEIPKILDRFFICIALLFSVLAAAVYVGIKKQQHSKSLIVVFVFAALFRVSLLQQAPLLSNDIYRYLWDGRLIEQNINPYAFPPNAIKLSHLRDSVMYPQMDHKHVRSVYPPLLQMIFWAGVKLGQVVEGGAITGYKFLLIVFDLVLIVVLMQGLKIFDLDPFWAILYAWHPLSIIEIAGSGHTDGIGALTLLLAVILLSKRKYYWGSVFLALGFLVKFISALLLPFLIIVLIKQEGIKKAVIATAIFAFIIVGSYVPFLSVGENLVSGLLVYSEKWRFNDGIFSLIYVPIHTILPDSAVTFLMIPPEWELNQETLASRRIDLALILSKAIVGLIFLAIYYSIWNKIKSGWISKGRLSWFKIALVIMSAFLLLSPTLQPWYLLWILPLLILTLIDEFRIRNSTVSKLSQFHWPYLPQEYFTKDNGARINRVAQMAGRLFSKFPVMKLVYHTMGARFNLALGALSMTIFLSYWILYDYLRYSLWQEIGWVKWLEFAIPLVASFLWRENKKAPDQQGLSKVR